MFECRESLPPEPSLRVMRFVEKLANCDCWPLSDRQQTPFIHVCQRQHSQYSKPPLLYNSVTVETTCFTGHSITLSHLFFPFFCTNTRPYQGLHWSLLLFHPLDSSARNVLDADEVSTPTIGWDAREAACTISRVSRAMRANDNFPPARSSRSRKDTFSVNYTTWRVWKCSHPTTLRKKVSLFCALYTMYVYYNRFLFEEKRPQHQSSPYHWVVGLLKQNLKGHKKEPSYFF